MWVRVCMKYNIHILEEPLTLFRVRSNEMNQSGNKPETHIRGAVEYQQLLRAYLTIPSKEMLFAVFPDLRQVALPRSNHIPFLVACYAAEHGGYLQQAFGISALYELMRDPATVHELEQKYGFSYPDLIRLTGEKDVFNMKELASLNSEIVRIKSTVSWRITSPLRVVWNLFRKIFPGRTINL